MFIAPAFLASNIVKRFSQAREMSPRDLWASLVIGSLLALAGCGGGSGGSLTPPAAQAPTSISVTLSPVSASVQAGGTQQFNATVTGTTNTNVSWSVNATPGGSPALGQVSTSGMFTAPAVVPSTNPVTVTAVSQADPSKSGAASIQITAPGTISINPRAATVIVGANQQFQVTLNGVSNTAVIWTVNGVNGGNSAVGIISNSGLYSAPATAPSPNTVTIGVSSQTNPSLNATAAVTIITSSSGSGSLNPVVSMQNSPGFTLTVNGAGFTNSSLIVFNGAVKPTTFVSASQVTAQISSSDLTQTGSFPVTVQTGGSQVAAFTYYVVPEIKSQIVSVNGGVDSPGVNIALQPDNYPQLALLEAGTGNNATTGGAEVAPGTQASILVVGNGLAPGTYFEVSGDGGDVMATQPVVSDFITTTSGQPAVRLTLIISSTAVPGPRNLLATNPAGEVSVFAGGVNVGGP